MTDTILFIKETSTCHYILVIQTPKLCGDPVFHSRSESREESTIRCREIISSPEQLEQNNEPLTEAAIPLHIQSSERARPTATPLKQEFLQPATVKLDKTMVSNLLRQLRTKGIANVFSFVEGGMLLEDIDDAGEVVMAYAVDLEGIDGAEIEGLTKGKQYPLTEDVIGALWDGGLDDEDKDDMWEEEAGRPLDEL